MRSPLHVGWQALDVERLAAECGTLLSPDLDCRLTVVRVARAVANPATDAVLSAVCRPA